MNVDEVVEVVARVLSSRQIQPIEQFILQQSWLGRSYEEMARDCAYCSTYLKEIGCWLWQDLSTAFGQKVTKKNLHIVLSQYEENAASEWFPVEEANQTNNILLQKRISKTGETPIPQELLDSNEIESISSHFADVKLEFPSDSVALESPLYINRPPVEELAFAEINQPGCVMRVKAPVKMGKTSLVTRIIARARDIGYKTAYLNFQEADEMVFGSLNKFLRWFCANLSRQLNLTAKLDDYWDEDMGSKVSCKIYFEAYLLAQIDCPFVLALDEVNRVFEHREIAGDFLPMLRFWHEQATRVEIWQKLRLVVAHATEVYIPLKLNQSPFNVGLSMTLPQFSLKQVQELAQRYGLNWAGAEEGGQCLAPLVAMVGGHPYLVSVALYHLCRGEVKLDELLQAAPTSAGIYKHHLRNYLAMLLEEAELAQALFEVMMGEGSVQLDAIAAYKLESMGLVKLDGNRAIPSCELYRLYFRQQLVFEQNNVHLELLQK